MGDLSRKKKFSIPHTYTIIFILILVTGMLTWVVPSGEYDRVEVNGRDTVVPGTYHQVEANPQNFMDIFASIIGGFVESAEIIGFILIIGGSFAIVNKTGAIESSIGYAVGRLKNKDLIIIPVCMIIFGLAGSVTGMGEELIPFYMIFVPLMCSLGYDSLTGISIVFIGSEVGFLASTTNPFTVGISQGIAQIVPGSGIGHRFIIFIILMGVSIYFVLRHAKKVKENPKLSIVYEDDIINKDKFTIDFSSIEKLNARRLMVLIFFILSMGSIVWGILKLDWDIANIATVFAILGVFSGLIGGLSEKDVSEAFIFGLEDVASAAFVIGLARGIVILAENGHIIDTLLDGSAHLLSSLPKPIFINSIMLMEGFLSIFIPSGSGLASLSMPVFIPLSDLVDVSAQLTITAFHLGKGIVSIFTPTSGILLTALSVGKVPYDKWFKFVMPLVVIIGLLCSVFLTLGIYLGV